MRRLITLVPRGVLSVVTLAATAVVSAAVTACGHDGTGTGITDPTEQFWSASLNAHAITMSTVAPYDTFQLVVTPRNSKGNPVSGTYVSRFTASDTTLVRVDSTGRLTARQETFGSTVQIVASQTDGHVTFYDTAFVNVTAVAPASALAQVTLALPPGVPTTLPVRSAQSYTFTAFERKQLVASATDASGTVIPGVLVAYRSSAPEVVRNPFGMLDPGIFPNATGVTTIVAEATMYGVTKSDSLTITVVPSRHVQFSINARTPASSRTPVAYFSPGSLTVGAGGVVTWLNQSGLTVDIAFDNPAAASAIPPENNTVIKLLIPDAEIGAVGGNFTMPATPAPNVPFEGRFFTTPGTYKFHSTKYPSAVGTIVVVP